MDENAVLLYIDIGILVLNLCVGMWVLGYYMGCKRMFQKWAEVQNKQKETLGSLIQITLDKEEKEIIKSQLSDE